MKKYFCSINTHSRGNFNRIIAGGVSLFGRAIIMEKRLHFLKE